MDFAKFETVSIKEHPELNEKWVQDRIAEDPTILGLGDVVLKDRERLQPRAGCLDFLIQSGDTARNNVIFLKMFIYCAQKDQE